MKSLYQNLFRLIALAVFVVLGAAATTRAQAARIQTSSLDHLTAKATDTVDISIDERLIGLASKFLSNKDEEAAVKDIVNGLKGIYVKSFEFESEGQYTQADLESIRSQLRGSAWNRLVNVSSKKEGSVEVYLMSNDGQASGLALLAMEPKELTLVNLIGLVDIDKLTQLQGHLGVPELGIQRSKRKRKN